jgi:serine/threonine-protein kinase
VVALSPDGSQVVYAANNSLWLRPVEQLQAIQVAGTEAEARGPFFSADGQSIGFWATGQLKKVSVSGGAPVILAEVPANPRGASWGADDMVLYGQPEGIMRVPGASGTPELLIPVEQGEVIHGPQMLPGDEWVLFTLRASGVSWDEAEIVAQSTVTGERTVLVSGGRDGRYVRTGHLVYGLNGVLFAVPFDVGSRRVTGGPVPLVEGVRSATGGGTAAAVQFSVSTNGSLAYVPGSAAGVQRTLVWVDREGREEPINVPPRAYTYARLAPDGSRIALDSRDEENDIWIWDLMRETLQRLTFDPGLNRGPSWTPDSQRIAFTAQRDGTENIYWQAADGSGTAELISESELPRAPKSFTADSTRMLFTQPLAPPYDIGVITVDSERQVEMLLETQFSEANGELSPDGEWLTYQSNESGQDEIYLRPFPDVDSSRRQVSTGGGSRPLWSRDGSELFYYVGPGTIMAVPIQLGAELILGRPEVIIQGSYATPLNTGRHYDVSLDGQRFLLLRDAGDTSADAAAPQVILVQNWFEELKERVPAP